MVIEQENLAQIIASGSTLDQDEAQSITSDGLVAVAWIDQFSATDLSETQAIIDLWGTLGGNV